MEPLSAFSVACNVIQVVDVGCKILSKAAEYHKSSDGVLEEQRRLRDISRTLVNLSNGLQSWLDDPSRSSRQSREENRLVEANDECLKLSKEFIDLLDSLKVKDQHAVFESLRMSIRARRYKDRMDAVKSALSEARDNLNMAFLLYMHSQQVTATNMTDSKIQASSANVEHNLATAINASSDEIQEEVRKLAEQLKNAFRDELPIAVLNSKPLNATNFAAEHSDIFQDLDRQLKLIRDGQSRIQSTKVEDQILAARQKILQSLCFPGIHDRWEQVQAAYSTTYEWILRQSDQEWQRWDCFITWVNTVNPQHRLYWIHGKPGSGKSTLMKFLDCNIDAHQHMSAWAGILPVIKVSCFFWATGTTLQKSLGGLYRSVLFQLLQNRPELVSRVTSAQRWKTSLVAKSNSTPEWVDSELRNALIKTVKQLESNSRVLLLLDGLDEFHGTDEEQNDLLDFLFHLADHQNVKICVSSRPRNAFWDAFRQCPKLGLEDLTHKDIELFVTSSLQSNHRWCFFERRFSNATASTINQVLISAAGVFLWVRLVISDLLRSLRDGDSLEQLRRKLDLIPPDLNDYFGRMIDSIEPQDRKEASTMLQLALHEETKFSTLHPLRLADLIFIDKDNEVFAIKSHDDSDILDFEDPETLSFRLDSALRKINSRCMGLLNVCNSEGQRVIDKDLIGQLDISSQPELPSLKLEIEETESSEWTSNLPIYELRVDFVHRSVKDFLCTPRMQTFLHQYTNGPFNARLYLLNARLLQFAALTRVKRNDCDNEAIGIASYILSGLSIYRETRNGALMASEMQNPITHLAARVENVPYYWYIAPSLNNWKYEQSNFLTLAIDFRLTSYVLPRLTRGIITQKRGRPILDYILRPRFANTWHIHINKSWPDVQMLRYALDQGASPNEIHPVEEVSVWALFISFLGCTNILYEASEDVQVACYQALEMLVGAGASTVLPKSSLSVPGAQDAFYSDEILYDEGELSFEERWPSATPVNQSEASNEHDILYTASSLLKSLEKCFSFDISPLLQELRRRETIQVFNHQHDRGNHMNE